MRSNDCTANNLAIAAALDNARELKAMQTLHGMIMGIMADGVLNDAEVALLSTWLSEHSSLCQRWPASSIYAAVRETLVDGRITEEERTALAAALQSFNPNSFADTGSAASEVAELPFDQVVHVNFSNATVCHTGVFLFGTRRRCERLTERLGGIPVDAVNRKTNILIVGGRVSPSWRQESYGAKIERAIELKTGKHGILILTEDAWIAAARSNAIDTSLD